MKNKFKENNSNWKGGRRISSNGYIQIRVEKNHPLRNANGYAYEHRIIAAKKYGIDAVLNGIIHHKDENKTNNNIDNLQLCDLMDHRFHHRKSKSVLKSLNEKNTKIKCLCGCGKTFYKYDKLNRAREYISGHNPQNNPTQKLLINLIDSGHNKISEIIFHSRKGKGTVYKILKRLIKTGKIEKVKCGIYIIINNK